VTRYEKLSLVLQSFLLLVVAGGLASVVFRPVAAPSESRADRLREVCANNPMDCAARDAAVRQYGELLLNPGANLLSSTAPIEASRSRLRHADDQYLATGHFTTRGL